jgi:hypothetical protein
MVDKKTTEEVLKAVNEKIASLHPVAGTQIDHAYLIAQEVLKRGIDPWKK